MSILNLFKKEPEYIAGLYIDELGNYQLIELQKIDQSYFPIFHTNSFIENFLTNGAFHKKSFIEKLKKDKNFLKSSIIKINSLKNKKLEQEIILALKIIGFDTVEVIENINIEGIILKNNLEKTISVYFDETKITFYQTSNGYIEKKTTILSEDLNISKIFELTKDIEQKHIFLSGVKPILLKATVNLFYVAGIKVHITNIWENFLDFKDGIPSIFPEASYKYIKALALAVPGLKKWELISEPTIISEEENNSESKKEKSNNKPKKEKQLFLPKRKKIFLPKKKKEENTKEMRKKEKKIFLPKPKKKDLPKKEMKKLWNLKKIATPIKKEGVNKKIIKEKKKKLFLPKPKKKDLPKKEMEKLWNLKKIASPAKKDTINNEEKKKNDFWKKIKKFLKSKI